MKKSTFLILLVGIILFSCKKEFNKFDRPEWLEGKMYTQLLTVPESDSFIVCIEKSGLDTLLNESGSYTAFVPDNKAFREYLAANPSYNSINDIPLEKVKEIARFHVIQNPWSRAQLRTLDINGWINKRDPVNNEPWGYKRQTLLRKDNKKYFVKINRDILSIVDSTVSSESRTVFQPSRKYVPLFFDEYMNVADVKNQDFDYLFNRPFEAGNIYYAGAKLYPEDYFAENGFIYTIDKVVSPLKNVEQIMESPDEGNSYSLFLNSVYQFPRFFENEEATNKQPGVKEGYEVPTLYNLDYNDLVFDIHEELTGRDVINSANTIRYHYGILAPTNQAMQLLIDNVITNKSGYPRWPSYTLAPENIKRIVVNSHMSLSPVYFSDLEKGFYNGEKDIVSVNPDDIIEKKYASNATFYGLNKPIIPRAFSSVTGPVYLRPGYSTFMNAIEYTNILPAIKREDADYSFFVRSNNSLSEDSTLFIEKSPVNSRLLIVTSYDRADDPPKAIRRGKFELTQQLLNHVGISVPKGVAKKEFIPNLAGNYIVYNSENHPETGGPTITGGLNSVYGFNGDSAINVTPVAMDVPTDNGVTYEIDGWLAFPRTGLYDMLNTYTDFFNLMRKAKLVDEKFYKLKFITESEFYTIFVPSSEALANFNSDTLSVEELQNFIKYHFVRGEHIFTDGNKSPGQYETLRVDEETTVFNTVYSTLDLRPQPDVIQIFDNLGNHVYDLEENEETTNKMSAVNLSSNNNEENYITNAVIHQIDTVLIKY